MKKTINFTVENVMINAHGTMTETKTYYTNMYVQWDKKPQSIMLVRTHK